MRIENWLLSSLVVLPFAGALIAGESGLAEAVRKHDKVAVAALMKQRADVNAPLGDGSTALHWAVHWDEQDLVDQLVKGGAKVDAADDLGVTPLSLSCVNGNAPIIRKLLAAKANPNAATAAGRTPLMTCARAGSLDGVKALIEYKADLNAKENLRGQTALMWAVAEKHADIVQTLLAKGADVNAHTGVTHKLITRVDLILMLPLCSDKVKTDCARGDLQEVGGSTALHFAARNGDQKSAEYLLAAGANIDDKGGDGNTALVVAAYGDQGAFGIFLLDKGANPNIADGGYSALHAAALRGDVKLVQALLAHKANPNVRLTKGTPVARDGQDYSLPEDMLGATPLFVAAKLVEIDIMRALVAAGADASIGVENGNTPLMVAAGIGWRNGFNRRGATVAAAHAPPDDDIETLDSVRLLISLGANVNAVNDLGETAMHGAAANGYAEVIQLLAEKGAALNVKNKKGQTPLMLATVSLERGKGRRSLKGAEIMLRKLGA